MKNQQNKKGSAIITAVGLGFILLIIIASVYSFTSYRTQTVIQESKKVKALALAEAGLEVALGELFNDSTFVTHSVKINGKKLEWESAQNRENMLSENSNHGFSIDSGNSGTISGKLGDGKFKVRVGNIPYEDDETTKAIDERKAYLKIEAMGCYDKTIRKIEAVVNRRYPAREFLMYDGGVLSVVYGTTNGENTNTFSIGHLYGHQGVEISTIITSAHTGNHENTGTKQELFDINSILSGAGGIFFYSDVKATFRSSTGNLLPKQTISKNCDFPRNGTYANPELEQFGQFPNELLETTPPIPDSISQWVKDKNSDIRITPRTPAFEQYKKSAQNGGMFVAAGGSGDNCFKYRMPKKWTKDGSDRFDVLYLDFGNKIHEKKVDVPNNGIIYSEKDIVIKGNPPKDLSIVSEKNIFVAGDFNQEGKPGRNEHHYGFPQDYESNDKNCLNANDYCADSKALFEDDITAKDGEKSHVAASVIAKERIVFDYRSPVDCFENEIVPYLKYRLAKEISDEHPEDAEKCLSPNTMFNVTIKASDSVDAFAEKVKSFTNTFQIGDQDAFVEKMKGYHTRNNGSFDFNLLDEMTKEAWKAYVEDFSGDMKGQLSSSGQNPDHGVYKLLYGLRNKIISDSDTVTKTPGASSDNFLDKKGDFLYYPEMTTNGMFISCAKQNNTFYAGPDVKKFYDEIGYSQNFIESDIVNQEFYNAKGFIHRIFGSQTYLRLYDVHQIPENKFQYRPPTRKKLYDYTLPQMNFNDKLELAGFVVMSWQDFSATPEEFEAF